jgi:hypothetical protein
MYGSTAPRGANAPNPLYNAPPSPLGSQPGGMMVPGMQPQGSQHGAASPAPPAGMFIG